MDIKEAIAAVRKYYDVADCPALIPVLQAAEEAEQLRKLAYYKDLNDDGTVRDTYTYKALLIGCRSECDVLREKLAEAELTLSGKTFSYPDYVEKNMALEQKLKVAVEALEGIAVTNLGACAFARVALAEIKGE